jgi:hypothetical protein
VTQSQAQHDSKYSVTAAITYRFSAQWVAFRCGHCRCLDIPIWPCSCAEIRTELKFLNAPRTEINILGTETTLPTGRPRTRGSIPSRAKKTSPPKFPPTGSPAHCPHLAGIVCSCPVVKQLIRISIPPIRSRVRWDASGGGECWTRPGQQSVRCAKTDTKWKDLILCAQQNFKLLRQTKQDLKKILIFLKFVISVRGVHCYFSPRSSKNCITRSFMLCTPHQISFGWSSQEDWDGQNMWHVRGRGEVHTGL